MGRQGGRGVLASGLHAAGSRTSALLRRTVLSCVMLGLLFFLPEWVHSPVILIGYMLLVSLPGMILETFGGGNTDTQLALLGLLLWGLVLSCLGWFGRKWMSRNRFRLLSIIPIAGIAAITISIRAFVVGYPVSRSYAPDNVHYLAYYKVATLPPGGLGACGGYYVRLKNRWGWSLAEARFRCEGELDPPLWSARGVRLPGLVEWDYSGDVKARESF